MLRAGRARLLQCTFGLFALSLIAVAAQSELLLPDGLVQQAGSGAAAGGPGRTAAMNCTMMVRREKQGQEGGR